MDEKGEKLLYFLGPIGIKESNGVILSLSWLGFPVLFLIHGGCLLGQMKISLL